MLSIFMMLNYFWGALPPCSVFGMLSLPAWSFFHAISAMVFSGSIITTTVLEWIVTTNTAEFAIRRLFSIERILVLPALTLNVVSGVAQVYGTYLPASTPLRYAPPHVKAVFHILFLFGLWWGFTDRMSQGPLERLLLTASPLEEEGILESQRGEKINGALKQRRLSNVVSCGFVLALYAIMIFKPGC
jgi:hypothetical protein